MRQIDIVKAFVNINKGFIGGMEVQVNDGEFVKWLDKTTKQSPPAPWCASMQAKAGQMLLGERWPVPLSASCQALADWAVLKGVLKKEPAVGALMLFWHQKDSRGPRFAHIACVTGILTPDHLATAEGNTSGEKGLANEGTGAFAKVRIPLAEDRFIHWWELLPATL